VSIVSNPPADSRTVSAPDALFPAPGLPPAPRHVPYYYENLAHGWWMARDSVRRTIECVARLAATDHDQAAAQRWVQERLEAALRLLEEKWPADMRAAYDQDHAQFERDWQRKQRSDARGVTTRRRRATQRAAAD